MGERADFIVVLSVFCEDTRFEISQPEAPFTMTASTIVTITAGSFYQFTWGMDATEPGEFQGLLPIHTPSETFEVEATVVIIE